jgi:hypothetical protein
VHCGCSSVAINKDPLNATNKALHVQQPFSVLFAICILTLAQGDYLGYGRLKQSASMLVALIDRDCARCASTQAPRAGCAFISDIGGGGDGVQLVSHRNCPSSHFLSVGVE